MTILDHARAELERINFGEADSAVILDCMERFLEHFDSGGAVMAALPVFMRLMVGQPLTPLTGDDAEWMEIADNVWQNKRCGSVFRDDHGVCYDLDHPAGRKQAIRFPYTPMSLQSASDTIIIEVESDILPAMKDQDQLELFPDHHAL